MSMRHPPQVHTWNRASQEQLWDVIEWRCPSSRQPWHPHQPTTHPRPNPLQNSPAAQKSPATTSHHHWQWQRLWANVNVFMTMHRSVSSLKLNEKDWGVKHIHNRMLWTVEVTNDAYPGLTCSEIRVALTNLNPAKAAGPISSITWVSRRFHSFDGFSTNPGSRHPSLKAGRSLTWGRSQRTARILKSWTATVQSHWPQQSGRWWDA